MGEGTTGPASAPSAPGHKLGPVPRLSQLIQTQPTQRRPLGLPLQTHSPPSSTLLCAGNGPVWAAPIFAGLPLGKIQLEAHMSCA